MNSSRDKESFRFLDLPSELRNRAYDFHFFAGENDMPLQHLYYDRVPRVPGTRRLGTWDKGPYKAITAHRQIHPYRDHMNRDDRYLGLEIFRTSRQIQAEAEPVFYGSASFNLMGSWCRDHFQSFEFLQRLPQRHRKLIKHVEHNWFVHHAPADHTVTLADYDRSKHSTFSDFDWQIFMMFWPKNAQLCRV